MHKRTLQQENLKSGQTVVPVHRNGQGKQQMCKKLMICIPEKSYSLKAILKSTRVVQKAFMIKMICLDFILMPLNCFILSLNVEIRTPFSHHFRNNWLECQLLLTFCSRCDIWTVWWKNSVQGFGPRLWLRCLGLPWHPKIPRGPLHLCQTQNIK